MALPKKQPHSSCEEVLNLWFEGINPEQHYASDPEFDALIRTKLVGPVKSHMTLWLQKIRKNKFKQMVWEDILKFWFEDVTQQQQYTNDPEFEAMVKTKFGDLYTSAKSGELLSWRNHPKGSLAEIVILHRFSRTILCDMDQAFKMDNLLLKLTQEAIEKGFDKNMKTEHKAFLHMLSRQPHGSS